MDPSLLELHGAQTQGKHTPLATVKFIGGLQTQRSPFASIDTRYNSKFFGGKPDSMIDGGNCEISNSLTLQRRFGLTNYGPQIPAPLDYYEWKQTSPPNLQIIIDTSTAIYNYSPTAAGILLYKSPGSGQTNFWGVVNTLYLGNGIDLFKIVGPNLLTQSNTPNVAPWTRVNATLLGAQFDPNGGLLAFKITWTATGVGSYVQQQVTPNYTPVALNTFTASVWLRAVNGSPNVTLYLQDQQGSNVSTNVITLTQTWTRYQVTGAMGAASTAVVLRVGNPSSTTNAIQIYGAQLEVGGPASPVLITTTQPQGVYLWGIVAPTIAPSVSQTVLSNYYQTGHAYSAGDTITDSNGNLETVTTGGTSGGAAPTWPLLVGTSVTDSGGVVWVQGGPNGLSPKTGYKWLYSFLNEYTGHPSNVSPFSISTATFANNLGVAYSISGVGSLDPQVNQIAVYRNVDGGAFWLQVGILANPPNGGTWTFVDTVQDVNISSIYAPIGLLNSPPPAGAINPAWHQSRMWVSVGANQYYSSGPDNAAVLNIVQNGVIAESFAPLNVIPLDQTIVRSWPTTSGLLDWTTGDLWVITGNDLASFNPVKVLAGHGIRSFNAIDSDGSTTWMYTGDRQFLSVNASAGSVELGFTIGDTLSSKIDPSKAYVARHVGGSIDNAVFVGDGSTGWYRVNPNQVGSSVSGEPSPVWSPFATITGGAQAFASVETTPGVHQFLVGAPGSSAIQTLGRLTGTGINSGSGTSWTNPSNVTLNDPVNPATVQLNIQGTVSGKDVFTSNTGVGTAVSTGAVTTTNNNEFAVVALAGLNSFIDPAGGSTGVTAGAGWSLGAAPAGMYNQVTQSGITTDYWFVFNTEFQTLTVAGAVTGTATLSRSNAWSAAIATFKTGTGAAPTLVQRVNTNNFGTPSTLTTVQASITVTQGNFMIVSAGTQGQAAALTMSDTLGNVFSPVVVTRNTAIFLAPVNVGGSSLVTLRTPLGTSYVLAMEIFEVTLPQTPGALNSKFLQATNYNLGVPNDNILGVKVFVTGSQTSTNPDATVTLSWINPVGASTPYTFQLPASSGTVSFGGVASTWGQVLTAALLNNTAFGFQLQANVVTTANVTFNVSAVQVQVFYLNSPPATFNVMFRDPTVFADVGTPFTWFGTIGSIYLANAGTLAETESITTEVRAASGAQPAVAVLLDEITGPFETLANSVNDPPQLAPSTSVISNRFYLSQGATPPLCRHLQIKLSGGATATKDELLSLTIRGALVPEQS